MGKAKFSGCFLPTHLFWGWIQPHKPTQILGKKYKDISRFKVNGVLSLEIVFRAAVVSHGRE